MKTLFRTVAEGPPAGQDRHYDEAFSLVEERVIILKARSHDEALRLAEIEAEEYAQAAPHRNPYGQDVVVRVLDGAVSWEMVEEPSRGAEVFSRTEVVSKSIGDEHVLNRLLGPGEDDSTAAKRRNVLDIAFNKPAEGVSLRSDESALIRRQKS